MCLSPLLHIDRITNYCVFVIFGFLYFAQEPSIESCDNVNMPRGAAARHNVFLCGDNIDTMNGPDGNRVGNYGVYILRQKA